METKSIAARASCAAGFEHDALPAEEALIRILERVQPVTACEVVATRDALGRTLSGDVLSPLDVPSHTNSAVDGYAVAGEVLPQGDSRLFPVAATILAGSPFTGTIRENECARIMTGAPMPCGTDTVIMQEHVDVQGGAVRIAPGHRPGENVRQAGEDLAAGQVAIASGKAITPAELGLLASLGIAEVGVRRRLRVAFFSTGDELRSVGQPLRPGDVYDSNRYTLFGMLRRLGVDMLDLGVVRDSPEALRQILEQAAEGSDAVISSGGVSVGEADYVKETLGQRGQVEFWKIAIKPGRPLAFGNLGKALFFGLPGNPVAVMVTFYQFVQPALHRLMGRKDISPPRFTARCLESLRKKPGRTEFLRGTLSQDAGQTVVSRSGAQGSGILSSMSHANCFIVLPADSAGVSAGEFVTVAPFEGMV